jgi:hypothetical protein
MRKSTKILGAVSIAGVLAAGGAAFTATGITTSGRAAAATQFIGGTVSQNVTEGVYLSNIAYNTDLPGVVLASIDLTFISGTAEGLVPLVTITATGSPSVACTAVSAGASHCDADGAGTDLTAQAFTHIVISLPTTP